MSRVQKARRRDQNRNTNKCSDVLPANMQAAELAEKKKRTVLPIFASKLVNVQRFLLIFRKLFSIFSIRSFYLRCICLLAMRGEASSCSQSLHHLMSLACRQVRGANLAMTGQNLQFHAFNLLLIYRIKNWFQQLPKGMSPSFSALLGLRYASNYPSRWLIKRPTG